MTSQFKSHSHFDSSFEGSHPNLGETADFDENLIEIDDRFELLSVYLDGEASFEECQQVETWLATDPQFRLLHDQMSRLQRDFQDLPVPDPIPASPELADCIFQRIDRQRQRRHLHWGGAIAAAFIAVVSGITLTTRSYTHQMAQSSLEIDGAEPKVALKSHNKPTSASSQVSSEPSIVSRALFVE